jgi:hypothetical protein
MKKSGGSKMMMMGAKAPKMQMGGKAYTSKPITAPGGTTLNGKKVTNKMS